MSTARPLRLQNPRRSVTAAPQLDRAGTTWRLRTCEVGTANINVSLLFGSASLVFLGLVYVMPSWAAGAIACCGLLVAALLVDRQENGCWWTLDHGLAPVDWLEPELGFDLACARGGRVEYSAPASGHVRPAPARTTEQGRRAVRAVPARIPRSTRTAVLSDRPAA
jgi:hypothetical protein